MIVGCGEWGFRELPMEEHFRIAQEFGFRYLEFGIGGDRAGRLPENPSRAEVAAFRRLTERYAIATPFCCLENDFTLPDPAAHRAMAEKVTEQMVRAAECGATHVRLFAGFTPLEEMTEAIWSRLRQALAACAEVAAGRGLTLAVETHGALRENADGSVTHLPTVTTDRGGLCRLLRELPPAVGINYDPGNIRAAHPDDPRLALDLLDRRINYCHLKDWQRRGAGWVACAIGDDALDYADLLRRMSFDGVYLIEYEPLHDTLAGIRRSLDYLTRAVPAWTFVEPSGPGRSGR